MRVMSLLHLAFTAAIANPKGCLLLYVAANSATREQSNSNYRPNAALATNVILRQPTLFLNIVDSTVSDSSQNWLI